jgi:hypothetical protein
MYKDEADRKAKVEAMLKVVFYCLSIYHATRMNSQVVNVNVSG